MNLFKPLLITTLILLAGCAGHDQYGTSDYEFEIGKDEQGNTELKKISISSGREADGLQAFYSRSTEGNVMFYIGANEIKAFEGQQIGAEVSNNIVNAVKEVLPDLVSQAVRAAIGLQTIEATSEAVKGVAPLLAPPPGIPLQQ